MGGLTIEKTKECHFIPEISSPKGARREIDVESTFVFHGNKSAQFLSPFEFSSSPPSEVGLTQNLGDPWAKILIANQFYFFEDYLRKYPLKIQ
jgi:hypothetical protein